MAKKMEKGGENTTFYLNTNKASSVIPAKRKLVKRLIFDEFISYFYSLCSSSHSVYNSGGDEYGSGGSNYKKNQKVYPI
uniref:Uncharacterized protein n=1 Tax=Chenopodium quinoa TaxID=63459 RepID=A0A803L754_CHEQI